MSWKQLDETMFVAGQISAGDMAEAARLGVSTIVNNRPDGEEPGQPPGAEIAAAARAAGLDYHHIPISEGYSNPQIAAMADALAAAEGRTLAFCNTGGRSTILWALAKARQGEDPDALVAQGAAAGFNLRPLRPYLG